MQRRIPEENYSQLQQVRKLQNSPTASLAFSVKSASFHLLKDQRFSV
jgi:hypothetical protein